MKDEILKRISQAQLALLEQLLFQATDEHDGMCAYGERLAFDDCDCGAQTNGGDLVDEVCSAIVAIRRELKGE